VLGTSGARMESARPPHACRPSGPGMAAQTTRKRYTTMLTIILIIIILLLLFGGFGYSRRGRRL
jgi:hypothetical protein